MHDHLAWGLVGLYKGNQDEEFYEPATSVRLVRQRPLRPGDYALLPPRDDVHRVRDLEVTSVSIHLLANDAGCVLRHVRPTDRGGEAVPIPAT